MNTGDCHRNTHKRWCRKHGVKPRSGAVGRHGSIAIVERFIRSLKNECTRRLMLVPMQKEQMLAELELYAAWFNEHRPHEALGGRTPNEAYFRRKPANAKPRLEPRAKWPRKSPCAAPQTKIRGPCGVRIELVMQFEANRSHLPIIRLKATA